jgi:hypothetical protein
MTRMEDLLAEALAIGRVPDSADDAERAELAELMAAAGILRAESAVVEAEATTARPVARARFERYLADAQRPAPAPVPAGPAPRGWRRLAGTNRFVLGGALAAVIGVIAVLALVGTQALTSSTETANALSPNDYAQVQGVVTGGGGNAFTLASDTGNVKLALSAETTTVGPDAAPANLKVGDVVLVSGVVGADGSIAATTVAVTGAPADQPVSSRPKLLKRIGAGVSGRVVLLSIAADGASARVVIETASGDRVLVQVEG